MKILAQVNDQGFIIQITNEEMYMLVGSGNYESERRGMLPGKELKIQKMYENARSILAAYSDIKTSVDTLKRQAIKISEFVSSKENPVSIIAKEEKQ